MESDIWHLLMFWSSILIYIEQRETNKMILLIYCMNIRQIYIFRIGANDSNWNTMLINTELEMINCYKFWYQFFFLLQKLNANIFVTLKKVPLYFLARHLSIKAWHISSLWQFHYTYQKAFWTNTNLVL